MERAVAIQKITKLLGKGVCWRVDPKAPSREEREAAKAGMAAANAERNAIQAKRDARYRAILEADAEYQALQAACEAARNRRNELLSLSHHYKITVGTIVGGMFNHVKAQGDSWEEVIGKLTA